MTLSLITTLLPPFPKLKPFSPLTFFFFPNYPLFGKWVQYRPGFSSQKRNLCDFHSFLTCSLFIHFSSLFYHSDPIHYQSISRRRISSKWILDLLLLLLLLYYDYTILLLYYTMAATALIQAPCNSHGNTITLPNCSPTSLLVFSPPLLN